MWYDSLLSPLLLCLFSCSPPSFSPSLSQIFMDLFSSSMVLWNFMVYFSSIGIILMDSFFWAPYEFFQSENLCPSLLGNVLLYSYFSLLFVLFSSLELILYSCSIFSKQYYFPNFSSNFSPFYLLMLLLGRLPKICIPNIILILKFLVFSF